MTIACTIATNIAELERLRPEWDELQRRSLSGGPMTASTWLLAWWKVFGADGKRQLAVAIFRDGDRLVGIAPLVRRTHWYPPALPFRRLEWMGTGEDQADEVCSEHLAPLAEPGFEIPVATALATAMKRGDLGAWDELVLPMMDGSAPFAGLFEDAFGLLGFDVERTVAGVSMRADLLRGFDDYVERLPSSNRYLVRRSLRDFENWARGDATLEVARTPETLGKGTDVLAKLHGERWNGRGVFASSRFSDFHRRVLPELLDAHALDLLWITCRGEPVAACYNLIWKDTAFFYQSGRRVDLPKNLRPGIVMHAFAIRHAIELGLRHYDFLCGESQYKRALTTSSRPLVTLRVVKTKGRESARLLTERAASQAKRFVRFAKGIDASRPSSHDGSEPQDGAATNGRAPAPAPTAVVFGDLNILRCFAAADAPPTLVASFDPRAPTFASTFCDARRVVLDPKVDVDGALESLLGVGRAFDERPVLFYGDDALLTLVSRHRGALGRAFRFLLPDAALVERLVDKSAFAELAREKGLPVPPTRTAEEATSAREVCKVLKLPCVVKPHSHVGWAHSAAIAELGSRPQKVLYAETEAELDAMLAVMRTFSPSFVVQEWIPGDESEVWSFHAYIRRDGTPLAHFVGRKIRAYPKAAGVSTFIELTRSEELVEIGLDVAKKLGLVGVMKLDFKRDPRTGTFYLLEVNPRFNLWHYLGSAHGVNLPMVAYADLTGRSLKQTREVKGARAAIEPFGPRLEGPRWIAFGDDMRAFFREHFRHGTLSVGAWLASLRGPKIYDVFAWNDPVPFFVYAAQETRYRAELVARAIGARRPKRIGERAPIRTRGAADRPSAHAAEGS